MSVRRGVRRAILALGALTLFGGVSSAGEPTALDRLNGALAASQPSGVNGWDGLRSFLMQSGVPRGSIPAADIGDAWKQVHRMDLHPSELLQNEWDDPRLAQHRAALEEALVLLPALDEAMSAERFFVPYRWDGKTLTDVPDRRGRALSTMQEHFTSFKLLGAINAAAMRRAAELGDWTEAAQRFETGLALAERMSRQLTLMEWIVGLSIEGVSHQEMRSLLNEMDVPDVACVAMLGDLDLHAAPWLDMAQVELGESIAASALANAGEDAAMVAMMRKAQREVMAIVRTTTRRITAEAAATGVMLRLERFHAREGRWPATLVEAMTQEEATDPISERVFEYRLVEEEGRAYSLRFPAGAAYIEESDGQRFDPWEINPVRQTGPLMSEMMGGGVDE